jgi:hypothetical protein
MRSRLVRSLLAGLAFAILSWLMFGEYDMLESGPQWLSMSVFVFLYPGLIASLAVSGNVHDGNLAVVALGNFFFYFAATYLLLGILARRRAKLTASLPSVHTSNQTKS